MSRQSQKLDQAIADASSVSRACATNASPIAQASEPLFILSAPRSFSSIVCAMIGQHPQMYGLPETNLFGADSVRDWWIQCSYASHNMDHGLLRAIAEVYFGGQTQNTIIRARGWLRRRSHFSTGYLLEKMSERLHPKHLVDKSPSLVYYPQALRRVFAMFPRARFIHLVRHPRGHGASVMKRIEFWRGRRRKGPQWIRDLASFPVAPGSTPVEGEPDPQGSWYVLNLNICAFLDSVPEQQKKRVQGEAMIADPDSGLRDIAMWMGLRTDSRAIEQMKHPETSPYARVGPPGAELGNDILFLRNPFLVSSRAARQSLEGPLAWRPDGAGFSPLVKDLARGFGYE